MYSNNLLYSDSLNEFTIWVSECRQAPENQTYGEEVIVCNADDYIDLAQYDHVTSTFMTCQRCEDKFMSTDIMAFVVSNEGITDQRYMLCPEDLHRMFDRIPHIVSQIEDQKYIILLKVEPITSLADYAERKSRVCQRYPVLGRMEIGVTDYISGTEHPNAEFWPGNQTLDAFLDLLDTADPLDYESDSLLQDMVPESLRSHVMLNFAIRILRRHGNCTQAGELFVQKAKKCVPELDQMELKRIWKTAIRCEQQNMDQSGYMPPEQHDPQWEPVIPFDAREGYHLPSFPLWTLPDHVRPFVEAVSENTQTPPDMAATAALAILATCLQGRYVVKAKDGWSEPTNLYVLMVAEPAERKSAITRLMLAPVEHFEIEYNKQHKTDFEKSDIMKQRLKRQKGRLEAMDSNDTDAEEKFLKESAEFEAISPLQLYCDDVTPEKLVSILARNNGRAAVISAEGGIFCQLAGGMYSTVVNLDVFLKAHCGDTIRCDRISRESEIIRKPALTMLLAAQPTILMGVMHNSTFRGRGLTARFLYSIPQTLVGNRKYTTEPISPTAEQQYFSLIQTLLKKATDAAKNDPEIIVLDNAASSLLEAFHYDLEPKLTTEYCDFADWAGKLEGAVVRISGILLLADTVGNHGISDTTKLVVNADIMQRAIEIGQYFTEHARAAYQIMGADPLILNCKRLLNVILSHGYMEFSQREIMRRCQSFSRVDIVKPILQELCNRHFLRLKEAKPYRGYGRPSSPEYQVNPALLTSDQTNR